MNTSHHLAILQASGLTPLGQRLVKEALAAVDSSISSSSRNNHDDTVDDEATDRVNRFKAWWTSTYREPFEYARLKAYMHLITQNLVEVLSADYLELSPQRPSNFMADVCQASDDPESSLREALVQRPLEQLDLDALHVERRLRRLAGKSFLKTINLSEKSDPHDNLLDLLERDSILLGTFKERGIVNNKRYEQIAHGIGLIRRSLLGNATSPSRSSMLDKQNV